MAKFRDMYRFVELVDAKNKERDSEYEDFEEDDPSVEDLRLISREEAINEYVLLASVERKKSKHVYEDCVHFKFLHPRPPNGRYFMEGREKLLQVKSEGRHFLVKARGLKTGMWKAWLKDSKDAVIIAIAFVGGIIMGAVGLYLTYKGLDN